MAEADIRRRMWAVFAMMACGIATVFVTFLVWRQELLAESVASAFFFGAALLIGGSAMLVALETPYIPKVTPAVFTGAALVIFSQFMNAIDELSPVRRVPFFGRDGALYMPYLDDVLLFLGMGILFASAYLAILDALLARARLMAESEKRQLALKSAEQYSHALALSEARAWQQLAELENLYDTAPAGLCLVSPEGRFQRVNRRMAEMDGLSPEDHIGRRVEDWLPETGRTLAQICNEVTRNGHARPNFELSVTSVAKGAGPRVWLASCFPISSPDGVVVGVQMVVQDISELKHAEAGRRHLEQQMQQSQKLESLGVLAGGIAHDFNNLLTGILGNTSLALERGEVDDKTRALLEAAVEAARRAAELTQQMLAYAGQSAIKPRFLDVSRLIQDNLPLLRASVTKRAALTLACAEELSPIVADPIQVQQLVMNLATNASEALGEDSGRITICTGEKDYSEDELAQCVVCEDPWPGRYVYIEVADSGCGIDPEALPRIFEPFYSTKFAGRGLGLSVAVGIVRRHRGALGVESTPGGGTVFRVLFPAARGQVSGAPAPASAETASWRGQGLVLVVDDEEMVRITAQEILEDLGFEVICAEDGVVAEGLFRQHRDRLVAVLLDLTMPGRSGADTYRAFASYGAAVPVVVCSGFSEDHALQQFEGERRVRFMHKPYAYDTVMRLMRKLTPSAADA